MISLSQAAQNLGKPYHWVRYQVASNKLGCKVGWAVILSPEDLEYLRGKARQNDK